MFSGSRRFRLCIAIWVAAYAYAAGARSDVPDYQRVRVALPQYLIEKSVEAHTHAPLVEPIPDSEPSSLLDNPTLPRFPRFRSRFLRALVPSEGHRSWRLELQTGARDIVFRSLRRCFSPSAGNEEEAWPAAVLRAAGQRVQVREGQNEISLRFSAPLGPLPALLGGCMAYGPGPMQTGRFLERRPAQLEALATQASGGPALQRIVFQTQSAGADVFAGESRRVDKALRYQSHQNLLFLLRCDNYQGAGAWKLTEPEARDRFVHTLGPKTLLDAFAGGNGHEMNRLLPSAWTAHPTQPRSPRVHPVAPLRLSALGPRAPVVRIQVPLEDELAWATAERIAVLMRSVGVRGAVLPNNMDGDNVHELALIRWYPASTDDALSLLALAGRQSDLSQAGYRAFLEDPRLLSPSPAQRREAAHALEKAWLQSGRLVPLMVSRPWIAIPPALKGIHVRSDGVPIFEQAYWWRD